MRKFENCDVLSVLREIMSHNTKHYQSDFDVDEKIFAEAAKEPDAWDRRLLWMSRPCGTHCLKEKDVFLFNSPEYSTWTAYAATADEIVAYAVQLNGYEDGALKGDLYELDYAIHCATAKNSAVYIAQVKLHCGDRDVIMAYSDDWRLKAREYDYDKREFIPLSQNKLDTLLGEMQKERLNGHYYPWDEVIRLHTVSTNSNGKILTGCLRPITARWSRAIRLKKMITSLLISRTMRTDTTSTRYMRNSISTAPTTSAGIAFPWATS